MTGQVPKITAIERTLCCVPFTPRCEAWNSLLVRNWRIGAVVQFITDPADIIGIGETGVHYTWQKTSDAAVARCIGANPADLRWNDGLGAGLQQAMFDIVGKSLGIAAFRLLGAEQVRKNVSIAW